MVLTAETLAFTLPVDDEETFVVEMTSIREQVANLPSGQDRVVMHQLEQFAKQPVAPALKDFPALVMHGFLRPNTDDPTKLEPYTPHLRRFAAVGISSSLAWGYTLLPTGAFQTNVHLRRLSAQVAGFPASPRPK
jgi:hypothetical protein